MAPCPANHHSENHTQNNFAIAASDRAAGGVIGLDGRVRPGIEYCLGHDHAQTEDAHAMRRRLQRFLPIVLIALMVQILAPVGATWAAAIAASDPLGGASICHSDPAAPSPQSDQSGGHRAHEGACSVCCAAQAGASLDTPKAEAVAVPYRPIVRVIWREEAPGRWSVRAGSNTQARAPPQAS